MSLTIICGYVRYQSIGHSIHAQWIRKISPVHCLGADAGVYVISQRCRVLRSPCVDRFDDLLQSLLRCCEEAGLVFAF